MEEERKINTTKQMPEIDDSEFQETIGLFRTGSQSIDARYNLGRASRQKRIKQMYQIVRKYDIVRGLTPSKFRMMLEELGPTFVKAGQILSMRSEILPESFCTELTKLRSDVEPMSYELVLDTLRREIDRPLEEVFDAIDPTPLGSASIAQVHVARLIDGSDVAVKVQRPGVRETMAQDIDIMRSITKWIDRLSSNEQFVDLQSVVEELWSTFKEETNFLVEARSLEEFRHNNADCKFVSCPRPYMSLCTEHVVVMDYIRGFSIANPDELVEAGYDLQEIGIKLVDNYAQQVMDDGFFHADPHPGNIIISGGKIVFIDLGMMGRLSSRYRHIMRDMVVAVAQRDTPKLKDGLLRFSVSGDSLDIDHAQLLSELDDIVDEYGTTNLEDLNLAEFLNALIIMARKNNIELPGIVTMLARSMVTLEGVVDEFLPGVSIVEIIGQHVAAHETYEQVIKDEIKQLSFESRGALHGALNAVSKADLVMDMLTRGQLKINMDVAGSQDPMEDFSHLADRLTLGVITAGLFVGSSIVYYARIQPVIFGIPVLGFIGYLVALILATWIVRDIISKTKKD